MRYIVRHFQHRPGAYWLSLVGVVLVLATMIAAVNYIPQQAAHAAATNNPTFLSKNARIGYNGVETAKNPKNWEMFLGNLNRTSYDSTETTINSVTAPNLKLHWTDSTIGRARVTSEVVEAEGMLYWGSWDGLLHASDSATGQDLWATNLGAKPGTCSGKLKGVVGTATIARVPINGIVTSVVFVGAGQDNLYALDAHTGTIIWQTNLGNDPAEFLYSSTAVYNGSVYIGVASTGDCPLVQGQVVQVNASTGQVQNTFKLMPDGCIGDGVWGSPAIDTKTGMLYLGTGNGNQTSCPHPGHLGASILEFNAANLSLVASWHIPTSDMVGLDNDFGSTPTLFNATISGVSHAMVGLINKDGYYYALDRANISAGPLWKVKISVGGSAPDYDASISASAFDFAGDKLYVAGSLTTIGGQQCAGSLRELDPNTGTIGWEDCLARPVLGPVLAVPGLAIVNAGNSMNVVDSQTGQILFTYQDTTVNANFWGAATISNGILYDGSNSGNLFAFGL